MISYRPFYRTLEDQERTVYSLIHHEGISSKTLHRMSQGMPITTKTLETLCRVLKCSVSEVIEYVEESPR